MAESPEARLERLEALFAEQDYTLQQLNDVVAHQDREVSRLHLQVERLQQQLEGLKTELSSNIDPVVDKPPHY